MNQTFKNAISIIISLLHTVWFNSHKRNKNSINGKVQAVEQFCFHRSAQENIGFSFVREIILNTFNIGRRCCRSSVVKLCSVCTVMQQIQQCNLVYKCWLWRPSFMPTSKCNICVVVINDVKIQHLCTISKMVLAVSRPYTL